MVSACLGVADKAKLPHGGHERPTTIPEATGLKHAITLLVRAGEGAGNPPTSRASAQLNIQGNRGHPTYGAEKSKDRRRKGVAKQGERLGVWIGAVAEAYPAADNGCPGLFRRGLGGVQAHVKAFCDGERDSL